MSPIRVLIVDDQALFREALRTLLSMRSELEVVGEAGDGWQALTVAAETRPDVVLMDMKMPGLDGVGAIRRLRVQSPEVKVVVLTTFDDDELVFEGLRAGAAGYLLKDASAERLLEAILAVASGQSFLQPAVAAKVVAEFSRLSTRPKVSADKLLSERELEVLRLLARGASNKEIASALFLAEGTIKNHITNVFTKLGVTDRTQAALKARDLGLF
ncbi:MAG TPA: response regulator transcription factor [Polyangiaceae bacterium]|jgi:DNA-binding NarL/FixJ family response regulator|nr:response regulator transcription factor [Polyangiaceae bacterium]